MALAMLLFFGVLWAGVASPLAAVATQASTQSSPANAPANSPAQNENPSSSSQAAPQNPPPQNSPATSPSRTSTPATAPAAAGQNHPPSAHPVHRKKKPATSDCTSAGAASPAPSGTTSGSAGSPPSNSTTPAAPLNCPPPKTVVHEGGAKEPVIELAGGEGGSQAAQQRATANQMLEAAEGNLKKMEGHPLTATQQDLVSQIRQFIDQSRSAVKAGAFDQARTLAWKAQTLSEELIKPDNQ